MAGEIEEPIRHDFQAGSFRSGSISFGRFESETLCWERRSSFSNNRYLEEVAKCSKPGIVTEKKAYFEAHFRKKGLLPPTSPSGRKYGTSDNHDISEKSDYDEKIHHISTVYGTPPCDAQFEPSCDSTDKAEGVNHSELGTFREIEMKENLDGEESNFDTSHVSNVTSGLFSDGPETEGNNDANAKSQQGSSSEEKVHSQVEYTKPRRYVSNISSRGSEEKTNKTINNIGMRLKAENKSSESSAPEKRQMRRIPRNEYGSKAKGGNDIQRSEKLSRIEQPQSSTLKNVSSRVHRRENRVSSAIDKPQPCIKQDNSRTSFKCNERSERRKEFDVKLEDKMHGKEAETHQHVSPQEKREAETKQLRKSLNFKARPLPSFHRGALRDSDGDKARSNNVKPGNVRTKSSKTDTRVCESSVLNDRPQASGATSCHSTVTSDSTPSSPCAVISKSQPSQPVIKSLARPRKHNDKDKLTSLLKHKGPEVKNTTSGKKMDGKQKKRTGPKTVVPA